LKSKIKLLKSTKMENKIIFKLLLDLTTLKLFVNGGLRREEVEEEIESNKMRSECRCSCWCL